MGGRDSPCTSSFGFGPKEILDLGFMKEGGSREMKINGGRKRENWEFGRERIGERSWPERKTSVSVKSDLMMRGSAEMRNEWIKDYL